MHPRAWCLGAAAIVAGAVAGSGAGCGTEFTSESGAGGSGGGGAATTTRTGTGTGAGGAPTGIGGSGGSGTGIGGSATGGSTPTGSPPCHPPGLADRFDGAQIDTSLWTVAADRVDVAQVSGKLRFSPHGGGADPPWAYVETVNLYDLRDCTVWVEAPRVFPAATDAETYFGIWIDEANWADITAVDDELRFQVQIDYGLAHEHWLDNPQNANSWWRIRQQSNVLYLETSTNGLHWDEQLYADDFPDVAHVEVVLGMNTWSVSTGSVSHVEFDNLNVQP